MSWLFREYAIKKLKNKIAPDNYIYMFTKKQLLVLSFSEKASKLKIEL